MFNFAKFNKGSKFDDDGAALPFTDTEGFYYISLYMSGETTVEELRKHCPPARLDASEDTAIDVLPFYEKPIRFKATAFWINSKAKFTHPCVVVRLIETDGIKGTETDTGIAFKVSLPTHMAKAISDLIDSDEAVKAVNQGECFIEPYSYYSAKRKDYCYAVNFS